MDRFYKNSPLHVSARGYSLNLEASHLFSVLMFTFGDDCKYIGVFSLGLYNWCMNIKIMVTFKFHYGMCANLLNNSKSGHLFTISIYALSPMHYKIYLALFSTVHVMYILNQVLDKHVNLVACIPNFISSHFDTLSSNHPIQLPYFYSYKSHLTPLFLLSVNAFLLFWVRTQSLHRSAFQCDIVYKLHLTVHS